MNKQTDKYNTDLSDWRQYTPMIPCPEDEGTDVIGDISFRPAKKGEPVYLYKKINWGEKMKKSKEKHHE